MTQFHPEGQNDKAFDKDTVIKIINSVLHKFQSSDGAAKATLQQELLALHGIIKELRGEITNIKPDDIKKEHIPTATDELDAVVEATEEATGTIMDSAEAIESICEELPNDTAAKISDKIVQIYEACSFQDITGQRITKVISALHNIEEKVDRLLSVIGESSDTQGSEPRDTRSKTSKSDDDLLNGPALPEQRVSQDDIDSILAEFDD